MDVEVEATSSLSSHAGVPPLCPFGRAAWHGSTARRAAEYGRQHQLVLVSCLALSPACGRCRCARGGGRAIHLAYPRALGLLGSWAPGLLGSWGEIGLPRSRDAGGLHRSWPSTQAISRGACRPIAPAFARLPCRTCSRLRRFRQVALTR